jgi:hypothetical protein
MQQRTKPIGTAIGHCPLSWLKTTKGRAVAHPLPNYCVNLTRNGVAVAGFHFILARAIHAAAGRLHS